MNPIIWLLFSGATDDDGSKATWKVSSDLSSSNRKLGPHSRLIDHLGSHLGCLLISQFVYLIWGLVLAKIQNDRIWISILGSETKQSSSFCCNRSDCSSFRLSRREWWAELILNFCLQCHKETKTTTASEINWSSQEGEIFYLAGVVWLFTFLLRLIELKQQTISMFIQLLGLQVRRSVSSR